MLYYDKRNCIGPVFNLAHPVDLEEIILNLHGLSSLSS